MLDLLMLALGLAFFAAKQPVSYLFTQQFTTMAGKPYWYAFMSGLLLAQWTFTGYDTSAHTIEETKNARVQAPWGIFLSVAISGLVGYLLIAFVTLATIRPNDENAKEPKVTSTKIAQRLPQLVM